MNKEIDSMGISVFLVATAIGLGAIWGKDLIARTIIIIFTTLSLIYLSFIEDYKKEVVKTE